MTQEKKPERPPSSGYLLFYQEKITQVQGLDFQNRAKAIGEQWKQVPDIEKMKYNEKAKQLTQKYNDELQQYYEKYPEIKEQDQQKQYAHEKYKLIKRAQDPFKAFCLTSIENLDRSTGFNTKKMLKTLRNEFKNLPNEEIVNITKAYNRLTDEQRQQIQTEFDNIFTSQESEEENNEEQ